MILDPTLNKMNIYSLGQDTICYIFSFLGHNINYYLVSKEIRRIYYSALQKYPIKVVLKTFTNYVPSYYYLVFPRIVCSEIIILTKHTRYLYLIKSVIKNIQAENLIKFSSLGNYSLENIRFLEESNNPDLKLVEITDNPMILDFSSLTRKKKVLEKINLTSCTINKLPEFHINYHFPEMIKLNYCDIKDPDFIKKFSIPMPYFSGLKELYLDNCGIDNLDFLENHLNLEILDISGCPNITDLTPVKQVRVLYMDNCRKILTLEPFRNQNLKSLFMTSSPIKDLDPIIGIKILYINNCSKILKIGMLKRLDVLSIHYTENINDLDQLEMIGYLHINKSHQYNLDNVKIDQLIC